MLVGVEVVAWNDDKNQPEGLSRSRFRVAQVEDSSDLPGEFAALPQLEVMQLLSAGIEDVFGHVPDGVMLCDARGAP